MKIPLEITIAERMCDSDCMFLDHWLGDGGKCILFGATLRPEKAYGHTEAWFRSDECEGIKLPEED